MSVCFSFSGLFVLPTTSANCLVVNRDFSNKSEVLLWWILTVDDSGDAVEFFLGKRSKQTYFIIENSRQTSESDRGLQWSYLVAFVFLVNQFLLFLSLFLCNQNWGVDLCFDLFKTDFVFNLALQLVNASLKVLCVHSHAESSLK